MIKLSDRVQRVQPSATIAISTRANELRAEGKDIINLGVGEPDFDTPAHICAAAKEAIDNGQTRYTPVDGTKALKQAIIDKFTRDNQLTYALDEVMACVGAKQCIYNACQALLNDGDEVLIPAPYWVSYPDMVKLAGGVPVAIASTVDDHFKLTPARLEKAITPKTKMLIINSPSNPTGMMYSPEDLTALAKVLVKHPNIVILTDDMYEHIHWQDHDFVNLLNIEPTLRDRTIVVNGVSKAYAMTGWRMGYMAAPAPLIKAMKKIQSQSTSNTCSITQAATVAALDGDQACVAEMRNAFIKRHDLMYEGLASIPGIKVLPSEGTFYIFPDFSEVIARLDGINDDVALAKLLLEKAEVAAVPGSAFGAPGCLRMSFATSEAQLKKALARIKAAVS